MHEAKKFDPLQPRDAQGRWVETGAELRNNLSGAIGTVLKAVKGGPLREGGFEVRTSGGQTATWQSSAVSVVRNRDGSKPTLAKPNTPAAAREQRTGSRITAGIDAVYNQPDSSSPRLRSERAADAKAAIAAVHDADARPAPDNGISGLSNQALDDARRTAPAADQAQVMREEATRRANVLAKDLLSRYGEIEPDITQTLQDLAGQFGGRMEGLEFRLKAEDSLTRKIRDKSLLSGKPMEEVSGKIGDALRYTMILDEADYSGGAGAALQAFQDQGLEIVDADNSWHPGNVYQGINSVMRTPDGLMFELQFHTQASFDAKMSTHADYEAVRDPSIPLEDRLAAWDRMATLQANVAVPPGVGSVGNARVYAPPTAPPPPPVPARPPGG